MKYILNVIINYSIRLFYYKLKNIFTINMQINRDNFIVN